MAKSKPGAGGGGGGGGSKSPGTGASNPTTDMSNIERRDGSKAGQTPRGGGKNSKKK